MQQSRGKRKVVLTQITAFVTIIQPFQILIQNISNKALKKS